MEKILDAYLCKIEYYQSMSVNYRKKAKDLGLLKELDETFQDIERDYL